MSSTDTAENNNSTDPPVSDPTPRPQRRRWLRALFLALVLGVAGFYGGAFMEGSMPGAAIGAVLGVIVGIYFAGRRPAKPHQPDTPASDLNPHNSKKSFAKGWLGILLAIAGLVASFIAYEPPMFKAVAVYPNGQRRSHPARFKTRQECYTWTQNQFAMMSEQMRRNPRGRYEGFHSYECQPADCSSKFECTLKNIMKGF